MSSRFIHIAVNNTILFFLERQFIRKGSRVNMAEICAHVGKWKMRLAEIILGMREGR
jgi:hypothetical protein